MDYVFCARSIRKGQFSAEPGATHFLKIPTDTDIVSPDHKVTKTLWTKEVMAKAIRGDGTEGEIVIYVHGFNNAQSEMLKRHRLIRAGLEAHGFKGIVVSFDWPSSDIALNYLEDRSDAKQTALRLVDEGIASFAALQRPDCHINLHVLAHSMGCYVVREAFDDADDRPAIAARNWSVSQVMLVSGDVSARSLGADSSKSSSLYRHCVRLTNYFNPLDDVLTLSNVKRVGVAPRVGRIGLPDGAPEKSVNVNCGNYYRKRRDEGAFDGVGNAAHTWYFHDPDFMRDALFTIHGEIDRNEIPGRATGDRGNLVLTG